MTISRQDGSLAASLLKEDRDASAATGRRKKIES